MIPVIWHHSNSFWDCALPRYILDRAARCMHVEKLSSVPMFYGQPTGVVVIPGRHSNDPVQYDHLCDAASHFRKVVFIIIGDEEGVFDSSKIRLTNAKIWWFMPPFNPKQDVDRVAPNGWPTDTIEMINEARKRNNGVRSFDWSFMGQVTHSRRIECVDAANALPRGRLLCTKGFTQGETREKYYDVMVRSRAVLCPSGPCTPDSFRFAEALEAGCIPIVDDATPNPMYPPGYWRYVFAGEALPFPLVEDWNTLPFIFEMLRADWDARIGACRLWWKNQKERLIREMKEDLGA